MTLNPYDMGVFAVIFLSVIFGIFRGFTREVLSIGGWISALIGTIYGYQLLRETVRGWVGNAFFGDLITVVVLFITFLVLFTLIIRTLSDKIKGSKLGGLDRALGLLFGLFRGCSLVIAVFFLSLFIWKRPEGRPLDFQTARTLPYIISGAETVVALLPEGFVPQKLVDSFGGVFERTAEDLMKSLARPQPKGKNPSESLTGEGTGESYKEESRQEMGRLFKTLVKFMAKKTKAFLDF